MYTTYSPYPPPPSRFEFNNDEIENSVSTTL